MKRQRLIALPVALSLALTANAGRCHGQTIVVGSKKFTESYVLAEIAKRQLHNAGFTVEHRQGMGGTIILWEALKGGGISLYPEYTGTIGQEILKNSRLITSAQIRPALARYGIGMSEELGFNNTYALVMQRQVADRLGIHTISDLQSHPALRVAVSHEFLARKDGWQPLCARYGINMQDVRGIDHSLAYEALKNGSIDITDAYSTDAKIAQYDLLVLKDNLSFFPQYRAVYLYRLGLPARAIAALNRLAGTIDDTRMTQLNAAAEQTKNYAVAAALYFGKAAYRSAKSQRASPVRYIGMLTIQHLNLVAVSLFFAILVGVPLGIVASRPGFAGQFILGAAGVIQTIPSLALLALLIPIPFLGIQKATAIVALFLYSLLPIIRSTATGLREIPAPMRESAAALGLRPAAQLYRIFLPMASPHILAGIKTSAVINVGAATLAALIGVRSLGEPILSGLNLNDNATILQGAIPAALLAIAVQVAFDLLDRVIIPKGLRIKPA
ncbi:MAG TPA: glycine betaine ABC transporter substrate-binding protein [Chthonomonadales bacterium]|nr:glycine betaine ABC transporter substrate-binding protein [Chthonomonadales bacterium]